MLIDCGANDPRCPPWHGRKLAARMQAGQHRALCLFCCGCVPMRGTARWVNDDQTRQSAEVLAFFAAYLGLDP